MADADGPPVDETLTTNVDAAPSSGNRSDPGTVHVYLGPERTRIVLAGEIDADLGAVLHEATMAAERARLPIEVDAHQVTFMDSSGVAFLARLSTRSASRVRLVRVPPSVRFLLEVTRIGELLDVDPADPPTTH
ncbi:MAG: STAS domain-containing protein [Cellulomonas sp.]